MLYPADRTCPHCTGRTYLTLERPQAEVCVACGRTLRWIEEAPVSAPRHDSVGPRHCDECDTIYRAVGSWHRFCSRRCRSRADYRQRRRCKDSAVVSA